MFSRTAKTPLMRSAAWRVSLWATLAFAGGTMLVFAFLQHFVAHDIQQRSDSWLSGEVVVLSDVAKHTPKDRLYSRAVGEVAELATQEIPNSMRSSDGLNDAVFFIQSGEHGEVKLWVGKGDGAAHLAAIRRAQLVPDGQADVLVDGFPVPFRVASHNMEDGSKLYLGLSERDERVVLRNLRLRFLVLWLFIVLLGFVIVFYVTRRMLGHVRDITEAASQIGRSDLNSRVPVSHRGDEVAHLALTLNGMLDRIQRSVNQLHTITDSLAHDLRSPLTAIRGQLEMYLSSERRQERTEPVVVAIDELDRLSDFLNISLDVAEARADALRLVRTDIDLDEVLRVMVDLYEPCMNEKGLTLSLHSAGAARISGDAALMHRMIANLLDNESKHLPAASTVTIQLRGRDEWVTVALEDDGPGFGDEISETLFLPRSKGDQSTGHGLGLAFVQAVVHAHGGRVTASNRPEGGARIIIALPALSSHQTEEPVPVLVSRS